MKLIISPLSNTTRQQQLCIDNIDFIVCWKKQSRSKGKARPKASPLIGLAGERVGIKYVSDYAKIRSAEL